MVAPNPVTLEWPGRFPWRHRMSDEMSKALMGMSTGNQPAPRWCAYLAVNLAMGALLCAAHRRGWSEGWRAGAPARWGTRWEDFDTSDGEP